MTHETETLCVSCHFDEEETLVMPYLRWWERWVLRMWHANLRSNGYPPERMLSHARVEMGLFRRRCPPDVVAAIDAQHDRLIPILQAQLN